MSESSQEHDELQAALLTEAKRMRDTLGLSSVQILATIEVGECTLKVVGGSGDWYARMQAMRETLIVDEEQTREHARNMIGKDRE